MMNRKGKEGAVSISGKRKAAECHDHIDANTCSEAKIAQRKKFKARRIRELKKTSESDETIQNIANGPMPFIFGFAKSKQADNEKQTSRKVKSRGKRTIFKKRNPGFGNMSQCKKRSPSIPETVSYAKSEPYIPEQNIFSISPFCSTDIEDLCSSSSSQEIEKCSAQLKKSPVKQCQIDEKPSGCAHRPLASTISYKSGLSDIKEIIERTRSLSFSHKDKKPATPSPKIKALSF